MYKFFIILKNRKAFILLFNKVFFIQKLVFLKKILFIYLLKILFNFGLFDFRVFFLIKKNIKLFNGI
jgi:hypothetical protein